jgi:hypothetical protein
MNPAVIRTNMERIALAALHWNMWPHPRVVRAYSVLFMMRKGGLV